MKVTEISEKYVKLLQTTYQKYKEIDVIYSGKKEADHSVSDLKFRAEPKVSGVSKSVKAKQRYGRKVKTIHSLRQYSPEEDKILLESIKIDGICNKTICRLSKQLGRTYASVQVRINNLSTGCGKRKYRMFTLQEDLLIVESAIQGLRNNNSLIDAQLENLEELASSMCRLQITLYDRWHNLLKIWILQYYKKNLNLEIRPMLINFLVENFSDINAIDWKVVSKVPEFSGHTLSSLKKTFYSKILISLSKHIKIEKTKMTMLDLATAASNYSFRKISKDRLSRQSRVIEHFVILVNKYCLKVDV